MPVDQYIGGIETRHPSSFIFTLFHEIFKDLGLVNFDEPFARLLTQGMVA